MGIRAGLDGGRKSPPPPGFVPRAVQPVASGYNFHRHYIMTLCGVAMDKIKTGRQVVHLPKIESRIQTPGLNLLFQSSLWQCASPF